MDFSDWYQENTKEIDTPEAIFISLLKDLADAFVRSDYYNVYDWLVKLEKYWREFFSESQKRDMAQMLQLEKFFVLCLENLATINIKPDLLDEFDKIIPIKKEREKRGNIFAYRNLSEAEEFFKQMLEEVKKY